MKNCNLVNYSTYRAISQFFGIVQHHSHRGQVMPLAELLLGYDACNGQIASSLLNRLIENLTTQELVKYDQVGFLLTARGLEMAINARLYVDLNRRNRVNEYIEYTYLHAEFFHKSNCHPIDYSAVVIEHVTSEEFDTALREKSQLYMQRVGKTDTNKG